MPQLAGVLLAPCRRRSRSARQGGRPTCSRRERCALRARRSVGGVGGQQGDDVGLEGLRGRALMRSSAGHPPQDGRAQLWLRVHDPRRVGAAAGARTRIFCAFRAEALPVELLPLLVWLLITGWLTLWRRHSRVGPALLVHHPDVVLPAGPSVCAESAAARIGVPCFTQQGRRLCGRAVNRLVTPSSAS